MDQQEDMTLAYQLGHYDGRKSVGRFSELPAMLCSADFETQDIVQKQINELTMATVKKTDAIIREAICSRLGNEWEISDLMGRVEARKCVGKPETTYFLDGEPILELHPVKTITRDAEIVTYQEYRFL